MINDDTLALIEEMQEEFPDLIFHAKKPWWLKSGFWVLSKVTKKSYKRFTQTIGMNIYFADLWSEFSDRNKCAILRHERVHLRQFEKYGVFLASFAYLFIFFPVGLSFCRAMMEKEAFEENVKTVIRESGASAEVKQKMKDFFISRFAGPEYLWMWPFKKQLSQWFENIWEKSLHSFYH